MKKYVAGFLFKDDLVALVKKNRGPGDMSGRLNAIGGKIEFLEPSISAMHREFREETGVVDMHWGMFCQLQGATWVVYFFRAWAPANCELQTLTDEHVDWYKVEYILNNPAIPKMNNLSWLIPMALDQTITFARVSDNT